MMKRFWRFSGGMHLFELRYVESDTAKERLAYRQTVRADRQASRQTDRQPDRQANRQTDRQADRQTCQLNGDHSLIHLRINLFSIRSRSVRLLSWPRLAGISPGSEESAEETREDYRLTGVTKNRQQLAKV